MGVQSLDPEGSRCSWIASEGRPRTHCHPWAWNSSTYIGVMDGVNDLVHDILYNYSILFHPWMVEGWLLSHQWRFPRNSSASGSPESVGRTPSARGPRTPRKPSRTSVRSFMFDLEVEERADGCALEPDVLPCCGREAISLVH